MDGDTDAMSEGPAEQAGHPEQRRHHGKARREPQLTPEQLIGYLEKAHFDGTRGHRGYHIGEVNAFLLRLVEAVHEGQPLGVLVRRQKFTPVVVEHGYDCSQVDHFLAAVVDLDPHAHVRPEVHRSALLTKLFG